MAVELKKKDEIIDKLNEELRINLLVKDVGNKDMFKVENMGKELQAYNKNIQAKF